MTTEQAINLSDFYQLMAIALRYPTEEWVEGLLDGSFADDAAACLEGMGLSADEADAAYDHLCSAVLSEASDAKELLHRLRVEYTGLFLVPKKEKIFIYESRYRYPKDADPKQYSMFISPCALHAEQCYKEAGVRVKSNLQEAPDHMATELEYMSYLYRRLAKARSGEGAADDSQDAPVWNARIESFRAKHLDKWYRAFLEELREKTESETYRALAVLGGLKIDGSGSVGSCTAGQ